MKPKSSEGKGIKEKFKYCLYETKCHRCGKINGWLLNPNYESGKALEKLILENIIYHDEFPFEVEHCEYCKAKTRQEWVGINRQRKEKQL